MTGGGAGAPRAPRPWPIVVRRATAADRDAVLGFASATWDGWDYVPSVWDDWLTAPDGILLVAAAERPDDGSDPRDANGDPIEPGRPIALTRLTMLSRDELWLEALRVDPRVRGLSVATDLQVAEMHWAAAQGGAPMIRYATAELNVASQRIGARAGFEVTGRWQHYGSGVEADPGQIAARRAAIGAAFETLAHDGTLVGPEPAAIAGWWERLAADPTFIAGSSMYEARHWAFCALTEARLGAHARAGEVLAARGDPDGWCLMLADRAASLADGELRPRLLCGDGAAALAMLDRLRRLGAPVVTLRLPDPEPPLLEGREGGIRGGGVRGTVAHHPDPGASDGRVASDARDRRRPGAVRR